MTRSYRFIAACCVCLSVLLSNACNKKPDDTDPKEYMIGALVHDIPQYLYKSTTYTFNASGIITPEEGVSYRWSAPDFAPDSCLTQSFACTSPKKTGTYTIVVSASCEGYHDRTASQVVAVIDPLFFNSVTDIIKGTDSIVDPRDGAIYHTRVYGALAWFVQNLNWAGAGYPYGKMEALGTPFGRLYSWNEATTGIRGGKTAGISTDGLGQGPQGVCPPDWSVPTNEDWVHLATVVHGGVSLSFFDNWAQIADPLCAYAKLNGAYLWPYSPRNTKSNKAAWNGLPGGNSVNYGNNYGNYGYFGFWLSATEADEDNGYYRYINYDVNQFPYHQTDKSSFGASVRCVRLINPQN